MYFIKSSSQQSGNKLNLGREVLAPCCSYERLPYEEVMLTLSKIQLASLHPRVRAYVLRLVAERAWQQIRDLANLEAAQQLAIAAVMADGCDCKGRHSGEISVAKTQ